MTPALSVPGTTPVPAIVYPDCDGKPMSDNMKQARWIHILYGNLRALFADRDDVLIASDNLWYPVEGRPDIRQAPDVYVAFGRPKGDRGSYKQWEEGDIPLTVAFEILSPGNTVEEMIAKHLFYDHYGVEEYYVYDPDHNALEVYERGLATLRRIRAVDGHVSKRLGIRFQMTSPEMTVYRPDGERFLYFEELRAERVREQQRADEATQVARRLAELSRKVRQGHASAEEQAELDRLEAEWS